MPIYTDKRNGRLFVQFDYKRQTFKQTLPAGATREQAKQLESKMRSDVFLQANGLAPRNEVMFEDAVQEYLATAIHKPAKFQKAEYVLVAAKPFFKTKSLRQITPGDIERFMTFRMRRPTMHERSRKPATVWREIAEVSAFFTFCVKNDYLEANPCRRVDKPSFDNIQDKVLAAADEPEFLSQFCDDTARDICVLVLNTGLSQNDALGLTDFNVNRADKLLTLTRGKTKRHYIVPLNDEAWNVIAPRLGKGLLFKSSKTGGKLTSIKRAVIGACRRVNDARKKAGKAEMARISIRDLRRTFATRLAENGADALTIALLLGHGDLRMVHRYARNVQVMRNAVEKLGKPATNLPNQIQQIR